MRSPGPLVVHITLARLLEDPGLSSKGAEGHDYQPVSSQCYYNHVHAFSANGEKTGLGH